MFEHVCIATDGSDCGRRAARAGIAVANRFDASVSALVAVDDELSRPDAESVANDVREMAAERHETAETHVVAGTPADVILETAEQVDATLLVLGRRGHSGFAERLLGSTTDRVLRRATVPVLTVGTRPATSRFESVLLTSDGSDQARAAIAPATTVAEGDDARLELLRVVDVAREAGPFSAGGVDQDYVDRLVDEIGEELDVFAAAVEEATRDASVDIESTVRTGTPAEEIAAFVEDADVDLVTMASIGTGSVTGRVLGSTTDRVLRLVAVPVLVVPGDA